MTGQGETAGKLAEDWLYCTCLITCCKGLRKTGDGDRPTSVRTTGTFGTQLLPTQKKKILFIKNFFLFFYRLGPLPSSNSPT